MKRAEEPLGFGKEPQETTGDDEVAKVLENQHKE